MSAGEARIDVRDAALFDRPTQSLSPADNADGDGASAIGQLALADGEVLGHYRVLRCLGRGGMGEVFEAVDLRSGARVAIKASIRPLDGEVDRARFLREGRLAAAISHPNVVYVFAADECRGVPVIVTELVTGGTLRDLVERQGRLAAMEAVDLMRQVAAGLDAAAREGVVHRDVKPSNCFIDTGGQVKIGDFGLAISTLEAAARPRGAGLEGTLAFASPEQLRGEPPDVRSDVYSAGATLYYLLTGRPPFAGADGTRLIAHALRDPTPSVRRVRPDVARGLDRVVRRCLAKDPADRPQSHTDLSRLLLPFGSTSSTPATLGFRALAGLVDMVALRGSDALLVFAALQWTEGGPASFALVVPALVIHIGYFGVCETVWGASPGKWIFGLRVVTTGLRPVDWRRAFIRSALWTLSTLPGGLAWLVLGPQTFSATTSSAAVAAYVAAQAATLMGFVALFSTARTRNAFAGVHEVLTGTRVVSRLVFESGPVRPHPLPSPIVSGTAPRLAHYVILDEAAPPGVVVGYDETLARRVWIRHGTPGAPPVPLARRQVSRPSRLHWLAGGGDGSTAWEVYEMAAGEALRGACRQPRSWTVVRGWLFDLADEIVAGSEDGTGVPLTPGRVWVTDAGATLLDWDADPDGGALPSPTVARFLDDVAAIGLGRGAESAEGVQQPEVLPLHAQAFLTELAAGRAGTADETVERLRALSTRRVTVTRARRGVHLVTCAAAPLFSVAAFLFLLVLPTLLAASPDAGVAEQARALASSGRLGWLSMLGVVLGAIAASALAGLVSSFAVPGGVAFRLLDLAVVGPDGRAVTRARGISRAAIAWIPALASLGLLMWLPTAGAFAVEPMWLPSLILLELFVAGGLLALIDPRRGFQDRIAGTSVVPR